MKYKLTLKEMLLATVCCCILVIVKNVFGPRYTSTRDYLTIIYLIITAICWGVFIYERIREFIRKHKK